jgi:putative ABC transport system permease protein
MLYDLRYTARSLIKNPGFTVFVVLILALGIGANTAVFSLVNAVLIRPLGFADPDRLVALHEGMPGAGFERTPFSPSDLLDVERAQQSFTSVGAYRTVPFELSGRGEPERIVGAKITARLFPLLGIKPAVGRLFSEAEDRPDSDLALIDWGLWQRRYRGDPNLIGQAILLDRRPYTVIGVMPESFRFPSRGPQFNNDPAAVWVPMAFTDPERTERGSFFNQSVIARLKDGVTIAEAQSELDVLGRRIQENYPPMLRSRIRAAQLRLSVGPLREEIAGQVGAPLLMLLGAVGLVLLVACANVANLTLSRAAARERELGVRTALGATRGRLLRLQLAEALLLTAAGGAIAIAIARSALEAVPAVVARGVPGLEDVSLDLRVLAFTGTLSVVTAVLFGVIPILATEGRDLNDLLHETSARTTMGGRRHRIQNGLVISTVALAFVLLVGAGLFLRSFSALIATDRGFQPGSVLTVSFALPREAYATAASVRNFHESLRQRAAALPGVRSAALATDLPLESYEIRVFTPEAIRVEESVGRSTRLSWVHGPFFQTFGMTLKRGRFFTEDEYAENRQVLIVNEKLANRFWPEEDPIGKRLKWGVRESPTPWLTIVGVVGDAADGPEAVAIMGDDRPIHAYEPFRQFPNIFLDKAVSGFGRDVKLALRVQGDPTLLVASMRRELARLDPQLAVARIALMTERMADTVAPQRFSTALVTAFAGGAVLLVAIGLYGLLAFGVARRTREIGVRMAIGADRHTIVRMVLNQGLKLVGGGLAIGLLISLGVTRLLSSLLYQTGSYDAVTFFIVPLVLAAVALLACGLPARRASRIDPIVALRYE